jgi:hypothetical protein
MLGLTHWRNANHNETEFSPIRLAKVLELDINGQEILGILLWGMQPFLSFSNAVQLRFPPLQLQGSLDLLKPTKFPIIQRSSVDVMGRPQGKPLKHCEP